MEGSGTRIGSDALVETFLPLLMTFRSSPHLFKSHVALLSTKKKFVELDCTTLICYVLMFTLQTKCELRAANIPMNILLVSPRMYYSPGAATHRSIKRRQRVVNCLHNSTIVPRGFLPAGSRGVVHQMVADVFLQYSVVEPSDGSLAQPALKGCLSMTNNDPHHKTSMQKR